MNGWVLMAHDDYADWNNAHGYLIGSFYSDIESVCRVITDDRWMKTAIVSVEYENDGEKALITTDKGALYGAYLCKMPMRDDVPTRASVR